jgi:hypothetical protein
VRPGESDKSMKWIYPSQEAAPRGVKLALLTEGNIQTTGNWTDDGRFKAWQRLFSRDKEIERSAVFNDMINNELIARRTSPKHAAFMTQALEQMVSHGKGAFIVDSGGKIRGLDCHTIIVDDLTENK